jgi:hypothetical protein
MKIHTEREREISSQIIEFLKSHPLLSIRSLEEKLKIPSTTIAKALSGREIPQKYLFAVIRELGGYGLKIDGHRIESFEDGHVIVLTKDIGPPKAKEIKTESGAYFEYRQKQARYIAGDILDIIE